MNDQFSPRFFFIEGNAKWNCWCCLDESKHVQTDRQDERAIEWGDSETRERERRKNRISSLARFVRSLDLLCTTSVGAHIRTIFPFSLSLPFSSLVPRTKHNNILFLLPLIFARRCMHTYLCSIQTHFAYVQLDVKWMAYKLKRSHWQGRKRQEGHRWRSIEKTKEKERDELAKISNAERERKTSNDQLSFKWRSSVISECRLFHYYHSLSLSPRWARAHESLWPFEAVWIMFVSLLRLSFLHSICSPLVSWTQATLDIRLNVVQLVIQSRNSDTYTYGRPRKHTHTHTWMNKRRVDVVSSLCEKRTLAFVISSY